VTEQVALLMDGWGRLQAELADLRARVATLEQRPVTAAAAQTAPATPPSDSPERERDALVRAGLPPVRAEELINRRAEVALSQLELRDQAIREGWLGSDRYREELRAINDRQVSLRDELDPFTYDRYLYETGEPNRVKVDTVIPGSVGAENGLLPGDLIESYGEQRIFDYRELRDATAAGVRGELVQVQVRRGSQILEVWLPRGPIGIRLDSARVAP
jgi:membrane-associated protease RseP (regulator of RpoE activity)